MYSRAIAATVLLLVSAVPLNGQETEAQLQRHIDSLAPLVAQAAIEAGTARQAFQEAARRRAASGRALDTLQVGPIQIVTPSDDASEALQLFGEVWTEGFPGADSPSLSRRIFTYQRATYDVDEIFVDGLRQQVVVPTWYTAARARSRVARGVGDALASDLADTELGLWMQGNPFTYRAPARLYREAVVANSLVVRRCLDGDVDACTSALGLDLEDGVLGVWYTPEERRDRVLAWAGYDALGLTGSVPSRWTNLYGTEFERCVDLSAPDACDLFMRPALDTWTPLPIYVRETLVALALELGGAGAWARLIEDPTMSAEEVLPYASGIPLDELVAEWRTWVVTNRPEVHAGLGATSALALLWILFFGATAARSTRWRSE